MKSRNIIWAMIFILVVAVCLIWFVFISQTSDERHGEIYVNGELVEVIEDLYPDEAEYTEIQTDEGYNKVGWFDGDIWVEEADCENQTCVEFGKLSTKGLSIICAPHGLEIRIIDGQDSADVVQ